MKDSPSPDTDQNVVGTSGDAAAIERFYREHAERVLAWTLRLGGPAVDAEDLTQEVFAIALRRLPDFRGDSKPSTWLFGITRRVVANARRKAAVRRFVGLGELPELPDTAPGADETVDRLRRRRQVQLALEKLGTSHREAIALVDLEGLSAVEAGELLGVPVGTIYSRLHLGRRAFAHALQRQGVTRESLIAEPGVSR
ncbi:MAG: RNA polymerase sigma factor [Proteobacteria bacterium]|nr:RNA polymerase sigma factor [Pseudomonadota bacterium]